MIEPYIERMNVVIESVGSYAYTLLLPIALWLFAISLWNYYNDNLRDKDNSCPLPPGTYGIPFIGETIHMVAQGWRFYETRRNKYGHIYKTHVMGKPTIRVWGTKNIHKIFQSEDQYLSMCWPASATKIIGQGSLVASSRAHHNNRRALMARAFTNRAVQNYSIRMEEIITKWVADQCDDISVVKALPEARKLAFEVSAAILLGVESSASQFNTLMSGMDTMVSNFFTLPLDIPGTGFHQAMAARKEVLEIMREVIAMKRSSNEGGECKGILSHLLVQCDDGHITQTELEDSLIESFFSSMNGIPSLCCSTLIHLAKNPEVIKKLLAELKEKELLNQNSHMCLETIKELPYLNQVWKEITRIGAPFGGGFRRVTKTFELEGYQIPAGWTVLYSIRDNHEAEENFDSHADFNPDRWANVKSNESWVTFGGKGIRSCIAQRYTTTFLGQFIALLVKHSSWEIHETNPSFKKFPLFLPSAQLPTVFHHRKANSV